MIKFCLSFLIIMGQVQGAFCQKMPSDYFEEGEKYYESKDYKHAVISFQHIVKNHPRNSLFPKAYYNVGYIYYQTKKYDSSVLVFRTILAGNNYEKEKIGGSVMKDPFANYRHSASEMLSEVYYKKKMYDTSLYYLYLSDTLYPYRHMCGNAYASNEIRYALKYADIYQKLGNPDLAIQSLLPAVFITISDNSEVLKQLKWLLRKKENLKKDLDFALDNIYPKTFQEKDGSETWYYFNFLNKEILVPGGYEDDEKSFDKEKAIQKIKTTKFYKLIQDESSD